MKYEEQTLRKVIRYFFLKRRRNSGLTQNELSEISNITRQFISQVESGKRQPSLLTFCNLAAAYNVSISELIEEIDILYIQFEQESAQKHP